MIGPGVGITSLAVMGGGAASVPPWKQFQNVLADGGYTAHGQFDATAYSSLSFVSGGIQSLTCLITGLVPIAPTSSARPAYNPIGHNGGPLIVPDGNDDVLSVDSVPYPVNGGPCEMWVSGYQTFLANADTTDRTVFSYGSSLTSSSQSRVIRRAVVGGVNRARVIVGTGSATAITDTAVDLTGYHVVRLRIDGTNAALSVDGNAPVTAARVPTTTNGRTALFAQLALNAGFWGGGISLLAVTPLLDDVTAAAVLAHLQTR